jgi:hypothetical protein
MPRFNRFEEPPETEDAEFSRRLLQRETSLPVSGVGELRDDSSETAGLRSIALQIPAELWHRLHVAALQRERSIEGLAQGALIDYARSLSPALME